MVALCQTLSCTQALTSSPGSLVLMEVNRTKAFHVFKFISGVRRDLVVHLEQQSCQLEVYFRGVLISEVLLLIHVVFTHQLVYTNNYDT